jgi:hypothetical protein
MRLRYNRYSAALDIFGAASLTILYFYWTRKVPNTPIWSMTDPQEAMFANILSELIGIWISVRLISFFIARNETRDRVRIRSVRLMRFVERAVVNIVVFRTGYEVARLRWELTWTNKISADRKKYFAADELAEMNFFYGKVREFCALIDDFEEVFDRTPIVFLDEQRARELLKDIEVARLGAETNILEETEEDSGLP